MSFGKLTKFIMEKKNLILAFYCLILLLILGLFTSVYQSFIRNILYQAMSNNVSAVTDQGIKRLNSIVDGHMKLMFSYKHYIEENKITFESPIPLKQQFFIDGILEHNNYVNTCIALEDGLASCYGSTIMDISEERCFAESLMGANCISSPYLDAGGDKIIYISVPLDYENGTIGVLLVTTYLKSFNEAFSIDFYGEQGYSYIFNTQGDLVIDSPKHPADAFFSNYLTYLEEVGNDPETIELIRNDMKMGLGGVAFVYSGGAQKFLSYKPFDIGNFKLYFVGVINEEVISKNEQMIMFYTTLLCVLATMVAVGVLLYIAITKRRQQKKTFRLAYYDTETTLYNKNFMEEYCKKIVTDKNTKYASVVIDINHFKVFNHMHGYETGTFILKTMGGIFEKSLKQGEIASRVSNDIFCLILKFTKQSEIVSRMREMVEEIKTELRSNSNLINIRITFACGIYMVDKKEPDLTKIFDNADVARQKTKTSGKSWITFFRNTMINQLKNEQEIENSMESALRDNEFEVYMQPKVDFETLKVIGAESLVRWIRPGKGIVSPIEFIPIFERSGFVTQLDFYIFEKTCIALNGWRKEGKMLDVIISVNMSRNHLRQDYFIDVLALIATRWEIPLDALEIEITESAFFEDSEYLVKVLHRIREEGFRLSMDDFGAGYSSLNMLKSIPLNVLKIDKEFLDQSGVSEKSRIIIASIIHMAKCLNVEVVCEGVETEEQADFLRNIGCDYAQGYLYAKPMPLKEFYEFVNKVNGEEGLKSHDGSYRYFYGANI